ncbi:GntR family transcriptional regulator, partial [Acinetobacter baumannii]
MFDRFSIRPDDTTPPYLQLAAWLRGQSVRGALAPGMGLPSELRLTELTGLSRPTVRRGLGKLV